MVICRPFENLRAVSLSNRFMIQTALHHDPMLIRADFLG